MAINESAKEFEDIQELIKQAQTRKLEIVTTIRNSTVNSAIMFIDLVGSTKRKMECADSPETWIFELSKFYEIIEKWIKKFDGTVVKYIGDELMAAFYGANAATNAISLASNYEVIEKDVSNVLSCETKIKIAIDYGSVFEINVPGQTENDVLGTPVDYSGRIS